MTDGDTSLAGAAPVERRSALRAGLSRLEGPQTMGRGAAFWMAAAAVVLGAVLYPSFSDPYTVGNAAYFLVWTFMAMGLGSSGATPAR